MKVKAQNCTFIKKKKKNNFFFYFLEGFEIFFEKSEKIYVHTNKVTAKFC